MAHFGSNYSIYWPGFYPCNYSGFFVTLDLTVTGSGLHCHALCQWIHHANNHSWHVDVISAEMWRKWFLWWTRKRKVLNEDQTYFHVSVHIYLTITRYKPAIWTVSGTLRCRVADQYLHPQIMKIIQKVKHNDERKETWNRISSHKNLLWKHSWCGLSILTMRYIWAVLFDSHYTFTFFV